MRAAAKAALPWIAEFRDPMWQGEYPEDPQIRKNWQALEAQVFDSASRVIVTTPGARRLYESRYPRYDKQRIRVIQNGYDEDVFSRAHPETAAPASSGRQLKLLHSGVIYPSERDPSAFFTALSLLKKKGAINATVLDVVLRATGNDEQLRRKIDELNIGDIVHLAQPIGYLAAIEEMLSADGLLVLQAENCNDQIPAKLYEYIRARRPIVALTAPEGDTADLLRAIQVGIQARLTSVEEIAAALTQFIAQSRRADWQPASDEVVESYSRFRQAGEFAQLLGEVAGG
jgi:glycosyltransferase involved in cell wall biosynthesis